MRQDGFSLPELLAVLVIAAAVLGMAVPALRALVLDARRTADINALVSAIQLARSESAKRSATVALCPSADAVTCGSADNGLEGGWIVYVDPDDNGRPDRSSDILLGYVPRTTGTIRANRDRFRFRPNFRRSSNGTISFCDSRGPGSARAVIVSYTGRPRVADVGPGDRPLNCPG
jgi:type IV fimbrial biogenesis protein FimT